MSKIKGGGKPGKNARRKNALKLLEARLVKFQEVGEDKPSWTTTRDGGKRTINHQGRPFQDEVQRMQKEIKHLKELIIG